MNTLVPKEAPKAPKYKYSRPKFEIGETVLVSQSWKNLSSQGKVLMASFKVKDNKWQWLYLVELPEPVNSRLLEKKIIATESDLTTLL